MLSVVIPTYNRIENLKLCLAGLLAQKGADEFEIIVVDDGSTDGTREWLLDEFIYKHPALYLSGGPNKGFRGGRARNFGTFNAHGDRFVFIDSDVVLNEGALAAYERAAAVQPEAVIVGRYFVLPKIGWNETNQEVLWEAPNYNALLERLRLQRYQPTKIDFNPDGLPWNWGIDLGGRPEKDYTEDYSQVGEGAGLGALSGNISYPRKLFLELGGFDERIVGHGGEDADLGLSADERKTQWLFARPIFGFHLWHPRDQQRNHREVQANIAFIDAKHGVGQYAGAKKYTDSQDWSDPIHYHKHLGSQLVKVPFNPQVYVYREHRYLKLSSPRWLAKLGFTWQDLEQVTQEFIDAAQHCGDAIEAEDKALLEAAKQAAILPELRAPAAPPPSAPAQPAPAPAQYNHVREFRKGHGARLLRVAGNPTVFVVRGESRMGITHPDWITWLGFGVEEVEEVSAETLGKFADAGPTPDALQIATGEINR